MKLLAILFLFSSLSCLGMFFYLGKVPHEEKSLKLRLGFSSAGIKRTKNLSEVTQLKGIVKEAQGMRSSVRSEVSSLQSEIRDLERTNSDLRYRYAEARSGRLEKRKWFGIISGFLGGCAIIVFVFNFVASKKST